MSNELTYYINNFRYRAPACVPLPDGRIAVLRPGFSEEPHLCKTMEELHASLLEYIQWNVSDHTVKRVRRAADRAASSAEISDLVNLINGSQS